MMSENNNSFPQIDKAKFAFAQKEEVIRDKKLDTKAVSYFKDALFRFSKNKASVAAFCIISILVLYAIIAPIFSPFTVSFREGVMQKVLPRHPWFYKLGFWDGSRAENINQIAYDYYKGIGLETGFEPVMKVTREYESVTYKGKKEIRSKYYDVKVDTYHKIGVIYKNMTNEEYEKLLKWQDATGIQVVYPAIDQNKIDRNAPKNLKEDANIWYKVNPKGQVVLDKKGELQPIYKTGKPEDHTSIRSKNDPGNYVYYLKNQTGKVVRIHYYQYYRYINSKTFIDLNDESKCVYDVGAEPFFKFGTNQYGQDIFTCLASGARFSFLLAISISAINLFIGACIGSMEGYYGGAFDMMTERFKEILAGVPFMITVTLFQLHLANKVGPVASLLFAFVLTGWVGMSSLVRTQFYRFKHQEYVLAARTLGATDRRIITKHIFPNAIGTIITSAVLVIPGVIFSESTLSYLGIVNLSSSNTTSVGTLLAGGQAYLKDFPHIIFFPAIFISLLEISFNLFGNGLRDAFNPSLRGAE